MHNHVAKELISKERLVMQSHLNFVFKWALHFSTLAIKIFTVVQNYFKP